MDRNRYYPLLEAFEERTLMSASPVHVTAPRPEKFCGGGFLLTGIPLATVIRNESKYNVTFQVSWGDESGARQYQNYSVRAGRSLRLDYVTACQLRDDPQVRFDKAIKSGSQSLSYRLAPGFSGNATVFKFVNVTWSASGPGVDLRRVS